MGKPMPADELIALIRDRPALVPAASAAAGCHSCRPLRRTRWQVLNVAQGLEPDPNAERSVPGKELTHSEV